MRNQASVVTIYYATGRYFASCTAAGADECAAVQGCARQNRAADANDDAVFNRSRFLEV